MIFLKGLPRWRFHSAVRGSIGARLQAPHYSTSTASSEVLTETLHAITDVKLAQLEEQQQSYELGKRALHNALKDEQHSRKRVQSLIDGAKKLPAMTPLGRDPSISIDNLRRFVEQAEFDPSVTSDFLTEYENTINKKLDEQSARYEFAALYGRLVKEWTSSGGGSAQDGENAVGREEMHKQRAIWKEYVFHPKNIDADAIKSYLDQLFTKNDSNAVKDAFKILQKDLEDFQKSWDDEVHFGETTVTKCIKSILKDGALSDHKRAALNGFLGNDMVLNEIADVLNMRMASRGSFEWSGVTTIEQRRHLNGRYRFFASDEDVLQTILMQYIGLKWATKVKEVLRQFISSTGVLKSTERTLTWDERRRRRYLLVGDNVHHSARSVESQENGYWKSEIFLDQLPNEMFEERSGYSDEGQENDEEYGRSSALSVIQGLLNRIRANVMMRRRLDRDTTVIRSDFKWFGPSLPHQSIFIVLEHFGVKKEWLDFFKKALEAPLVFRDEVGSATQIRRRGTPISTTLETFFSEKLLFCADFAVNQRANGSLLYRLHDDIWLWGDSEACIQSWNALTEFSDVMGIEINEEKTGSCTILAKGSKRTTTSSDALPRGDVSWGFLKLDPEAGRFLINQAEIDKHISELSLQLSACNSVFDFIEAWNLYGGRFFQAHCGQVAWCTGRQHVNEILKTFQRIQSALFPSTSGNVGLYLKKMIGDRLGHVPRIPNGFLYYPSTMGGLGLLNPLINLYIIRNDNAKDPEIFMDEFFEVERTAYQQAKKRYEAREFEKKGRPIAEELGGDWEDFRGKPFMSFEEYLQDPDLTSSTQGDCYRRLLTIPEPRGVEISGQDKLNEFEKISPDDRDWTDYETWVVELYAREIIDRFGTLVIIEKGLLPTSLVTMLRNNRFKWKN
ncbi:unnamed protein product [Clonostachys byssicola]|uniref:Reverse transcriptase domain-containing protein n=1 Tax=Clonostachys byssicola TaxID=160290 RepID=A0A9N9Y2F4_9HYPO|nr:unnamed protein product [Clonostachys byssicola]